VSIVLCLLYIGGFQRSRTEDLFTFLSLFFFKSFLSYFGKKKMLCFHFRLLEFVQFLSRLVCCPNNDTIESIGFQISQHSKKIEPPHTFLSFTFKRRGGLGRESDDKERNTHELVLNLQHFQAE
jgi:hypothetical protein